MQPTPMAQPYLKVLVTGDRHWSDYGLIEDQFVALLAEFGRPLLIIHGGQLGADSLAHRAAVSLKQAVHKYPAEWERYGRAAGPKRNQVMIEQNRDIDLCLVVHDNVYASQGGTADCMRRAQRAGIPIRIVKH